MINKNIKDLKDLDFKTKRIEIVEENGKPYVAFCVEWTTHNCFECEDFSHCKIAGKKKNLRKKEKTQFT